MTLFQDNNSLEVENPQSREEDEELEEQRRRQEEARDLLATGIHAFNYDESTMNSSLTSVEGVDPTYKDLVKNKELKYDDSGKTLEKLSSGFSDVIESNYKNVDHQEQLKVLYDVRVREINNLREEFNSFKEEKANEIKILKNKITLSEAELRHLQITLSNSESLLVEKNDIIKNLKQSVTSKDEEILNLKKLLDEQNLEICTYKSTTNELQLKLADNNPFNAGARKLKSEELQKVHQNQIVKLETLLQEQLKKVNVLEKEKLRLEENVKKLISDKNETDEENNLTIMGLSKKLQSAQQQCKDLFVLGEAIKKESDHFKERVQQFETNQLDLLGESFQVKQWDKDTMLIHLEKLKRMLLDKDIELNTLKAKQKFYDSDLNELFEYRELLNKMYSYKAKPCSNGEHEELIIFMQGQLQSCQQAIEDRNNQIMTLNMVNKELQEKIEEMIQQTRIDIQNLSQKYSLPQLETMSNELRNAEETINNLKQQEEDLTKKLEKASQENEELRQVVIKDRRRFDEILKKVKQELSIDEEKKKLLHEIEEYKKTEKELIEENGRAKTQLQKICLKLGLSEAEIFETEGDVHEVSSLQAKYGKIHDQLQCVLAHLENTNVKRANFNIILKLKTDIEIYLNNKLEKTQIEEKLEEWDNLLSDFIESLKHSDSFAKVEKDNVEELTNAKTVLEGEKVALENQLKIRTRELEEAKKEIVALSADKINLRKVSENNENAIQKLNHEIHNLKKCLQIVEANKLEVEKQLEITQKQLNEAKEETIELHKEVNEVNDDLVRKNLFKELKDVEDVLEKTNDDVLGSDNFQNCLQAQILKVEIALRDRLQDENIKKMQRIEDQYKNVITEKSEIYDKEKEKWKRQEANYRKQFAAVLEECGRKMEELENENINLIRRINIMIQEHNAFKKNAVNSIEKYDKLVHDSKKSVEDLHKRWSTLLEYYMIKVAKVEKQRQNSAKTVLKKITLHKTEINLVENLYNEKIKKIKAEGMKLNQ